MQTKLTPRALSAQILTPALALLPEQMDTPAARVMLAAIALQESALQYRRQMPTGPARGLWQFEPGTRASRGGVWGVYLHRASSGHLRNLCAARQIECMPSVIWAALEFDDVLAAGVARLLLWTDQRPLPTSEAAGWDYYYRNWRPGKPRPEKWPGNWRAAQEVLL